MHKKVGIIGRFGFGKNLLNGQTIKTKSLFNALSSVLGEDRIIRIDTYGKFKMLLRLPFSCVYALCICTDLIILPAYKGIRVIAPLLVFLNVFFRKKLHYVVIGAWLNDLLQGKPMLAWCLKQFDLIYAETTAMKQKLEAMGIQNVVVMPNFKALSVVDKSTVKNHKDNACYLCTFSRVMREKGIETAVNAVDTVNAKIGYTYYHLDIYGQIDEAQQEWFAELQNRFHSNIRYCGEVPFDRSVSVLEEYDALLFPTQFYTEGIPGTIIDAYAAGIPVIAAKWENYTDIIDDETGIGYTFADPDGLIHILFELLNNTSRLSDMSPACKRKANDFLVESVVPILLSKLDVLL